MAVLKYQQLDGLNTVLPIGTRKINAFRTLTTESLAVFIPFKVQEIMDKGGIYFGENAISHNLIMCNKENLLNQSAFVLGVPGSGKSFSVKELIAFLILNTDDDILVCDPEGEYAPLVEAMGDLGSVIRVSAGGRDRLNAMYKKAAVAAYKAAVVLAKAVAAAVKAIIAAVKALVAAIAAGGWVAVVVILVVCLVALIVGSVFGIFFSSEDTGSEKSMQTVVREINSDYQNQLAEIKAAYTYDDVEMSGSTAVWREVLSIYAVRTNTDPDNPQEVATLDRDKESYLIDVFWEMNEIHSRTETETVTVIVESDDGHGNIVEEEQEETRTTLYITVSHKTADEMADGYDFTEEQRQLLEDLLDEKNQSLWAAVLYGIHSGDGEIVAVALSQIGNVGGQPYWSWYGFGSRVEWCACFVSWCANECGYIEDGIIPKYAGCVNGVQWFRDRDQWIDGNEEPVPGMIIFFDWDDPDGSAGPQDGESDHTGIVERVEDGVVYTVEGNSGDSCRENHYPVGYYEILGYGVPAY